MLGIVHVGIATVSKCPEFELDDKESEKLAESVTIVLREFDVSPDPKVTAVVGLLTTCGSIYYPRYYLIKERRSEELKQKEISNVEPLFNFSDMNTNALTVAAK